MITLDRLKSSGCISTDYESIDYHGTKSVSVSELLSWSERRRAQFEGVVICDNCLWAATLKKIPLTKASKVYTSDGESVCCWDSSKRMLFIKRLVDNKLTTIKQLKIHSKAELKEEISMSGIDLTGMDELAKMDIDNIGAPVTADATSNESAQSQLNRQFIEKMQEKNIAIADNISIITTNQRIGRSLGFLTKTDKVTRIGLTKVPKLNAQNKVILNTLGEEDARVKKDYQDYVSGVEGAKKPANKYLVTQFDFKFREAKPGKIVAMIIAIPAQTAGIDYASLIDGKGTIDTSKGEALVTRILPMETAYDYLINAFDGKIKEDEEIMGARAAWLSVKAVVVKPKDGASVTTDGIRYSLTLTEKTETRKSLLTEGNYIPAKVYKTMSQNDIKSAEDAALLNNNICQLFAKGDKLENLTDSAKKIVNADGTEAAYFDVAASSRVTIDAPDAFDGSGKVANVQVAVRDKKTSAKGNVTYPFMFEPGFDAVLAKPATKKIMAKAQISAEELQKQITKLTKSTTKSKGSKNINSIDIETLKRFSKTKDQKTLKDLSAVLAGIS